MITANIWLIWLADSYLSLLITFEGHIINQKMLVQPLLTSESPVYHMDSPKDLTAASLLNPAACWGSGPALSDGRSWTSELRPEKYSLHLWSCSPSICREEDFIKPSLTFRLCTEEKEILYLRVSSLQCGLSSPAESSFTPESCSLFRLKSRSFRWDGLDFRAEARERQLSSVNRQHINLQRGNSFNKPQIVVRSQIEAKYNIYLRVSSLQFGLSTPTDSCFTPESCRLL